MTKNTDIQIGQVYRDRNSGGSTQWVRVLNTVEGETDWYWVEPISGDDPPYGVWGGCLSKNAHH